MDQAPAPPTDFAAARARAGGAGYLAWRRQHADPPGTACANCATELKGPWCHHCGQLAHGMHRSAWHLVVEALEGLFHADGRLFRTLPRLFFRPAALTRDYLAGKRASQIAPMRLFLVTLLLVFLAGEIGHGTGHLNFQIQSGPEDAAQLKHLQVVLNTPWDAQITTWTRERLGLALAHPDALLAAMGHYAHDVAFLALPVSASLLGLLFVFRRRFVLFDHLIFSIHSLCAQGLLFVAAMALSQLVGSRAYLVFLAAPVHLFAHMRGVYGTGVIGTIARMTVLATFSLIGFALLVVLLVVLGLSDLHAP